MSSLIDLAAPGVTLPSEIVIDTTLVVAHILSDVQTPHPSTGAKTEAFFRALQRGNSIGVITSTTLAELFRFVIKSIYRSELPNHRPQLVASIPTKRRFDWMDLYKLDPGVLRRFSRAIERLPELLAANDLLVLQPDELGSIAAGRSLEQEWIRLIVDYGLDSNDAAILLEAQRAGITSIASLDRDMQRAVADFDIYTWL